MNMLCTGLLCFLINPFMDWLTNKSENIVEIIPSTQAKHTNGQPIVSSGSLNNKQIVIGTMYPNIPLSSANQ